MRWRNLALLLGIVAMGAGTGASAQDNERGIYLGLALEQFKTDIRGSGNGNSFDVGTRPIGFTGRLGYHLFSWLSVEAKASFGIHDDDNEGSIGNGNNIRNGETELKHLYGVAIKPQYQRRLGDAATFTVYGLGGYADFELEGDIQDNTPLNPQMASFTIEDNSAYFGGGLQMDGEASSFVLQYVRYFDDEVNGNDVEIDGLQVGVNVYF